MTEGRRLFQSSFLIKDPVRIVEAVWIAEVATTAETQMGSELSPGLEDDFGQEKNYRLQQESGILSPDFTAISIYLVLL
ncbi:MAG: hypothetical protein K9L59_18325 [Desulfobacterales bacterium]|nr:hypothetical protein [Desulfobacterales bacterium]